MILQIISMHFILLENLPLKLKRFRNLRLGFEIRADRLEICLVTIAVKQIGVFENQYNYCQTTDVFYKWWSNYFGNIRK